MIIKQPINYGKKGKKKVEILGNNILERLIESKVTWLALMKCIQNEYLNKISSQNEVKIGSAMLEWE